jgi:hypothetical protein
MQNQASARTRASVVRHAARELGETKALHLLASLADSEHISTLLLAERAAPSAACLRELIWPRAVFLEQLGRTPIAERRRFARRADRIIEQLGLSMSPSGHGNTVGRHDKT